MVLGPANLEWVQEAVFPETKINRREIDNTPYPEAVV
jgi:hypothetical protein